MRLILEELVTFKPTVIEGIPCFSPTTAYSDEDYPSSAYKEYASLESQHFWFRSRANVLVHFINRFMGNLSDGIYLEIGCGTGFVSRELERNSRLQIIASDVHIHGLKFADKSESTITYVQVDAKQFPFKQVFLGVGAFDVLEHIADDDDVLLGIYSLLKPDGYFFLSVPQYQWMWSQLDDIGGHKRRYSKRELFYKLKESGFEIEYLSSFMFTMFPLMVLSRFLRRKGKVPQSEYGELKLNRYINMILTVAAFADVVLMKMGISLPWGGSLIAVARKRK